MSRPRVTSLLLAPALRRSISQAGMQAMPEAALWVRGDRFQLVVTFEGSVRRAPQALKPHLATFPTQATARALLKQGEADATRALKARRRPK